MQRERERSREEVCFTSQGECISQVSLAYRGSADKVYDVAYAWGLEVIHISAGLIACSNIYLSHVVERVMFRCMHAMWQFHGGTRSRAQQRGMMMPCLPQ